MKRLATLLLSLLVLLPAAAQESGLAFLRIGTNAAGLALGDAHVAHSRDAFATYWNPAGLAAATENLAAISHHRWIADQRTYALAARFQAGRNGGVGLFVTATGSGDLEARQQPGRPDGVFEAQFVSTGIAYGRTLGPVRAGVTAKYLSERIFANAATGYAFDFGVQAELVRGSLLLGAALQNVGEMGALSNEATELPRTLRLGTTIFPFRILMEADGTALLNTFLTAELSRNLPDATTRFHLGVAAEVVETVTLRAGYLTNDALRGATFGAGLVFTGFVFDYAVVPFRDGFGNAGHVLTLTYGW